MKGVAVDVGAGLVNVVAAQGGHQRLELQALSFSVGQGYTVRIWVANTVLIQVGRVGLGGRLEQRPVDGGRVVHAVLVEMGRLGLRGMLNPRWVGHGSWFGVLTVWWSWRLCSVKRAVLPGRTLYDVASADYVHAVAGDVGRFVAGVEQAGVGDVLHGALPTHGDGLQVLGRAAGNFLKFGIPLRVRP